MKTYIKYFNEIGINDITQVGGKNASLGEMYQNLADKGIAVPDGFALTSDAYWDFLDYNDLRNKLIDALSKLDTSDFANLHQVGGKCRQLILSGSFHKELKEKIKEGYNYLTTKYGEKVSFAARSSATAEDLPNASFAGQQETYLNVTGIDNLLKACLRCYASLYTDRAIKYRTDNGFEHSKVALSVGVQVMVRSDKACSGVMFSLDPDTGFEKVVLIAGAWGLGENVVQGSVNTDEFLVFKPFLGKVKQAIISRKLGTKEKTMIYSEKSVQDILKPEDAIINLDTSLDQQQTFILSDVEVTKLAQWAVFIEQHYKRHMDIEWAKDGATGELFIVQARPETVHSQKSKNTLFKEYKIKEKGKLICKGIGLGNSIVSGKARLLKSPSEMDKLAKGEILVTGRTDPDWDPVLKKAGAIITDQGGRTSHAAIVAREVGATAIVGTGDATRTIKDGQLITVSTAEGNTGFIYEGKASWDEKEIDLSKIVIPKTDVMLILGDPDKAFSYSVLPNEGIGLMRTEFIINNAIRIHPMALRHFEKITDEKVRQEIEKLTHYYADKQDYFIQRLAEATANIAAAFYPKDVIVRMSDFKSNEYANLIGGHQFEPKEENPMIGFRGASRYYHPLYREAFEMECNSMKLVREDMGFTNVKLMLPFVRNVAEAKKVIQLMDDKGLKRGVDGLQLYMMLEIPSNALLVEEFAKYFDGFSIGSNDLTQLTLGVDRDSELLSEVFDPFDPAVMQLIKMAIEKANALGVKIGLCGQAPSDYPDYAQFLVECGIDSISFNPDALLKGMENIVMAENKLKK
ncbi:phosphoenolpyruvate synthase [Flavobacterium frigoris]|uniref:Phosphoenolpyruvate synthase n=1 Tax=Flavobacterium frigoris (strain PS1) TaxID=1086011 RepID=H7FWH4_FLAFP|nr:phosphoenolpyruvate synthase [Flavobacterium frigoris]EIA07146.1 phosphoenolpyruvate synthase [Flavobacterium frigoris PS1]